MPAANFLGYADKLSVAPGETIAFKVSTTHDHFDARIARFTRGPCHSGAAGEAGPPLESGTHAGRQQPIPIGSYMLVPNDDVLRLDAALTIQAWIYATLPERRREQGIVARWSHLSGFALLLDGAGRLTFQLGDGAGKVTRLTAPDPLPAQRWFFIAAAYDHGSARLLWHELPRAWIAGASGEVAAANIPPPAPVDVPLLIGTLRQRDDAIGNPHAVGCFNGKIERPRLWNRALRPEEIGALAAGEDTSTPQDGLLADWDFAAEFATTTVTDRSPNHLHGETVNMPTRAVTGHAWDGSDDSFLARPEHYGAIAFHEDDLANCHWQTDFTFTVPDDAPSGVYAAFLTAGDEQEEIPFYIRPSSNAAPAPILYLAPTNTYLAYANFQMNLSRAAAPDADPSKPERFTATDRLLIARPDLAASVYDHHCDGSGVCYSSRLRPVITMRSPATENLTAAPRHFSADLYLTEWLDRDGFPYDVATDEDLHLQGLALLSPYRVIVTGSHPEYWTTPMLETLEAYLANGGRLMYLGGNGFYWVTAMDSSQPHLVEVRRGLNGTRSWTSAPGETRLSLTGEIGGLWRNRGRFPNKLVGNGFAAQGWDAGANYIRLPDSFTPRAAFIFAGIGDDETIGDFGIVGNGAAGDEVDRYDLDLGTPPETLRLATSEGQHSDAYQLVIEDTESSQAHWGGSACPNVRADMVYLETAGGGAVFSVGSINWIASLPHNDFANNVARITGNVLRRFAALDKE